MYYTHFLINVATCHGMSCFEYFSKKILKDEIATSLRSSQWRKSRIRFSSHNTLLKMIEWVDEIATSSNLETVELLEMTEQEKI